MEIIRPGQHNHDAGPDFLEALIRIDGTLWAGNVEVHSLSSDWMRHRHDHDDAYQNVILHVVYRHDHDIKRVNGETLVTLALENYIGTEFYNAWQSMVNNDLWIPCAREFHAISPAVVHSWLESLCAERMEMRCAELQRLSTTYAGDPAQIHYHSMVTAFGFSLNRGPAELLARQAPLLLISKYRGDLTRLEALLFGQAGFLERRHRDHYPRILHREYLFLKHKHGLKPIQGHLWKFLRLRPNNFPSIRLAQLSMLLHTHENPAGALAMAGNPREAAEIFKAKVSEYWCTHYIFDKASKSSPKELTSSSASLLLMNHAIPWLFFEGTRRNDERLRAKAMEWLEELKPEVNSLTRKFTALGIRPETAMDTQGLIQLKKHYCDGKRCLDCRIGLKLLGEGL